MQLTAGVQLHVQVIEHVRAMAEQHTVDGTPNPTITSAPTSAASCITPGLAALVTSYADDAAALITLPFAFNYQSEQEWCSRV
jgi:hypothetical protein